MRLKLGRPDLANHRRHFDLPEAGPQSQLGVTFMGVSSLLVDDGSSALLTDGFFSRPSMGKVLLGKLEPDPRRIDACLERANVSGLDFVGVVPVHSHFDHVMDSAAVAERLDCPLVGGDSTAQVGIGRGLGDEQIRVLGSGQSIRLGAWTLTLIASEHCPPDRYPGTITEPLRPPVRVQAYRCGEAWSILLGHDSGQTMLIQGSAGFVRGALAGHSAQVAYLGVGQLGLMPRDYIEEYWNQTVGELGAKQVVLTHWDDFFRPLPIGPNDPPLRALPYAGDDLDVTMDVFRELAARDDVSLSFPTLWQREDPWQKE
jgi:L-ascorbate metabolism protein UlaG (beta-lactamase superfamily)